MKKLYLLVWIVILSSSVIHAQDGEANEGLFAYFNDALYILADNALTPYETCQPDEKVIGVFNQSPDGSRFIISTMPKIVTEAIAQIGTLGDMPLSPNWWLCDTANGTLERFYAMEGGDEAFFDELPPLYFVNSTPTWSPDSTQLAWTRFTFDGEVTSLIVLNLADDTLTETVLDLPPPFGFPAPPETYWTTNGIVLLMYGFNDETFVGEYSAYIVDPLTGSQERFVYFTEGETADYVLHKQLVLVDGEPQLAVKFYEAGWSVVNLVTGELTPFTGTLSASTADAPTTLLFDIDQNYNNSWQVVDANPPIVLEGYTNNRIALSGDGQVAYADSVLHLVVDGTVVDVANSDGFADDYSAQIIWAPITWGLATSAAVAEAALPTCEGTQQSRLRAGDTARIIQPSIPNNVRDNPSTTATLIGQIPGAGVFTVIGGPVCANGYAWYEVNFDGLQGWTVEGGATEYYLEVVTP